MAPWSDPEEPVAVPAASLGVTKASPDPGHRAICLLGGILLAGWGDPGLLLFHPSDVSPSLPAHHIPHSSLVLHTAPFAPLMLIPRVTSLQKMTLFTTCFSSSLPAAAKQHPGKRCGAGKGRNGVGPTWKHQPGRAAGLQGRVSGWGRVDGPSLPQRAVKGRERVKKGVFISFLFWGREEATGRCCS